MSILKSLAVVDDGDHVLHVAVWVLPVPQVLLFVQLGLVSVPRDNAGVSVGHHALPVPCSHQPDRQPMLLPPDTSLNIKHTPECSTLTEEQRCCFKQILKNMKE